MNLNGRAAIAGLGITEQGKVYRHNHVGFAVEAVQLALADAGLERGDLDGLIVNPGLTWGGWVVPIGLCLGIVAVMGLVMMGVAIVTFSKPE